MKKKLLHSLLALLLLLGLSAPAHATTPPPTGRPLAEVLNPDGTLRPGANGSFDARQFRMSTAPDGRPVFRPAGTTGAGDERWADGFGLPNGVDGAVFAIVKAGNNIYIGGRFKSIGAVVAQNIAMWNGTSWNALGTGINGARSGYGSAVYALVAASNGDIYAGGFFTIAGGVAANGVARWNGSVWSNLGSGFTPMSSTSDGVFALAFASNGDLYVGGSGYQMGTVTANRIAKWNGSAWSALGTGPANGITVGYNVRTLAVAPNGDLYAGGSFTQIGGVNANNVARWNGTVWSSLGTGMSNSSGNSPVYALAIAGNGNVYAAGYFTQAGSVAATNIAKWNGTAWSNLGSGVGSAAIDGISALAIAGSGDVYVGGHFTQAGGLAATNIAKWNGTAWSVLGLGVGSASGENANALLVSGTDVYAGGYFAKAGSALTSNLAKWNGATWSSLGTGVGNGINGAIYALAVASNGDVYAGGAFSQAGGIAANSIAKWNGTAWSTLGTGTGNGVDGNVRALALASNGDVYVGGQFTQAGGVAANNIAKWNGTAWNTLGAGIGAATYEIVNALAISGTDVYAGGQFTQAGGVPAANIARWNGTSWNTIGTGAINGVNSYVKVLAASGANVYVGGNFTQAGSVVANCIARWNGVSWNSVGTGLANGVSGPEVNGLAIVGNNLLVSGYFNQAGGASANAVAKWSGSSWSALGNGPTNGVSGPAQAMVVASNGDVYVGGSFSQAGGVSAIRVAKWNGTAWSALGTGLNEDGATLALAMGPNDKLYAGGSFSTTGDSSKVMVHFGIYDPAAPLATAAARATPAAQLFPNPAHGTATLRLPAGAPRLQLMLNDALGRTVRRYPAPATSDAELDLRGLPAGTYVVRCGAYSQRLVVE